MTKQTTAKPPLASTRKADLYTTTAQELFARCKVGKLHNIVAPLAGMPDGHHAVYLLDQPGKVWIISSDEKAKHEAMMDDVSAQSKAKADALKPKRNA